MDGRDPGPLVPPKCALDYVERGADWHNRSSLLRQVAVESRPLDDDPRAVLDDNARAPRFAHVAEERGVEDLEIGDREPENRPRTKRDVINEKAADDQRGRRITDADCSPQRPNTRPEEASPRAESNTH